MSRSDASLPVPVKDLDAPVRQKALEIAAGLVAGDHTCNLYVVPYSNRRAARRVQAECTSAVFASQGEAHE